MVPPPVIVLKLSVLASLCGLLPWPPCGLRLGLRHGQRELSRVDTVGEWNVGRNGLHGARARATDVHGCLAIISFRRKIAMPTDDSMYIRGIEVLTAAIRALGVPTFLLMGMSVALYQAVTFTAENVAMPVIDRHIRYLDAVERTMQEQNKILYTFSSQVTDTIKLLQDLSAAQKETAEWSARAATASERNENRLELLLHSRQPNGNKQ